MYIDIYYKDMKLIIVNNIEILVIKKKKVFKLIVEIFRYFFIIGIFLYCM